jgi:hypothetical protein
LRAYYVDNPPAVSMNQKKVENINNATQGKSFHLLRSIIPNKDSE